MTARRSLELHGYQNNKWIFEVADAFRRSRVNSEPQFSELHLHCPGGEHHLRISHMSGLDRFHVRMSADIGEGGIQIVDFGGWARPDLLDVLRQEPDGPYQGSLRLGESGRWQHVLYQEPCFPCLLLHTIRIEQVSLDVSIADGPHRDEALATVTGALQQRAQHAAVRQGDIPLRRPPGARREGHWKDK